jgi:hypothetical protein
MACLKALLKFGFISTHCKLQEVTKMCVTIMQDNVVVHHNASIQPGQEGINSPRIEMAKSAIDVLIGVSDLRMSYRFQI